MQFKMIDLESLVVNPSNDRHGPLASEQDAIEWLLSNKANEMRKLASDIAAQSAVYDPPLVKPEGKNFVVYDGNRRTTCAKLINNPAKAPEAWRQYFLDLESQLVSSNLTSLTCQVETDQVTIDRILERRHNGSQDGIGQIKWDPRAKANHADRVGGKASYKLAGKIEEYLSSIGYPNPKKIKRSNLDKLLDSKARKQRVGIELGPNGEIAFLKPKDEVSRTLIRIAQDLETGELSLKNLLLARDKEEYLDRLGSDGFQTDNDALVGPEDPTETKPVPKPAKPKRPKARKTLIPETDFEIGWKPSQNKLEQLWYQLQFNLDLERNTISVSVVFRVFLELLVQDCLQVYKTRDRKKLSNNLTGLVDALSSADVLDKKSAEDIKRICTDTRAVISVENLQRLLHSSTQMPSPSDLRAFWDCLQPLIVVLVKRDGKP